MAINIFSLFGSIMVDSDEANKSIQKTGDNAKSLGDKMSKGLKTAGKVAAGIATAAAGAATAAGAALKTAVDDTAAYADEIDKASLRSGLGAENLQKLKYAAEQSGASLSNIENTAKKFNAQLAEISEGSDASKEVAKAFDTLGIAFKDADGNLRSTDELYNETLMALAGMPDSAERTALATTLMGKGFTDLKPLLEQGSAGITTLEENAEKLGIVMSEETVKAGVQFGDTVADIKTALGGMGRAIGASVLPTFQKFANKIIEILPRVQSFIDKLIPPIENIADIIIDIGMDLLDNVLPPLLDLVGNLAKPVGNLIKSVLPVLVKILDKIVPIISDIVEFLLPPMVDILDALMPILDILLDALEPILKVVKAVIKPLGEILEAIAPLIEAVVDLIGDALEPFDISMGNTSDTLNKILGPALEFVADMLGNVVLPAFNGAIDFFKGDWESGLQNAGTAFTGAFQSAFDLIDSLLGTKLGEWYSKVTDFFQSFGSQIYQMSHEGEINEIELHSKYSDVAQDVRLETNNNIRKGMAAEDALAAAKQKYLKTSEALYYWDNYGNYDAQEAEAAIRAAEKQRVRVSTGPSVPKLARGGLVYGDTLALVGDNVDAKANPEVVAPISDLSDIFAAALDRVADRIIAAMPEGGDFVGEIDGTELLRFTVNGINRMTRQRGKAVIKQM